MALLGADVPDGEPQGEAAVEPGVRQEHLAGGVHGVEQPRVQVVEVAGGLGRVRAEAHHRERGGGEALEAAVGVDPVREEPGEPHVLGEAAADAVGAEVAQHHPQLQGAEPAPELHPGVHEVAHRPRLAALQVVGGQGEGLLQPVHAAAVEGAQVEGDEQPLVGVDDQRVGAVAPRQRLLVARHHRRGPRVGGVDVQPQPLAGADVGDGRHRVDAGDRGGADGRHHRQRRHPVPPVLRDGGGEGVGAQAEALVGGDAPQPVVAQPQRHHGLVDRRVGVLGAVDARRREVGAAGEAALAHLGHRLPGRGERVQGRDRGGVVDDPLEAVGQPEQAPQPPEGRLFELGHRRRGAPQHALGVEPGAQEVGEDAGAAGADREVGEEPGVVPVGQAGHDDALDVVADGAPRLAGVGRGRGQGVADLARLHPRQHRVALGFLEIAGDPVDQLVAGPPERRRVHVAEVRR